MDAQYAAHAAHAVDPWVLDGCPLARRRATQQLTDFPHELLSRERTGEKPEGNPQRRCTPWHVIDNDDGAELRERCDNIALRPVRNEDVRRAVRGQRDRLRDRRCLEEAKVRPFAQAFADVAPEVRLGGDDEHR